MFKYFTWAVVLTCIIFSCKSNDGAEEHGSITAGDTLQIKKDVNAFLGTYAQWAKASLFDSIATLYAKTGTVFVNTEEVEWASYDSIKKTYAEQEAKIKWFSWKEPMVIDVLKKDAVAVAGAYSYLFGFLKDTLNYKYSAVLVKTGEGWKIKQENEMPELETAKKIHEIMEKQALKKDSTQQ